METIQITVTKDCKYCKHLPMVITGTICEECIYKGNLPKFELHPSYTPAQPPAGEKERNLIEVISTNRKPPIKLNRVNDV